MRSPSIDWDLRWARADRVERHGRTIEEARELWRQAAKSAACCGGCFRPLAPTDSVTMEMRNIILFALAALASPTSAEPQSQTTFRDDRGRTVGTAQSDSQGTITFRDARGRTTGTASRDSQGTVTFRNAIGRTIGKTQ